MKIKFDDLEILGYYPYTSHVLHVVCEYDGFIHNDGDTLAERLYERLVREMEVRGRLDCVDNKSAYKVLHKPTNTILYIGCYDSRYRIGLSCKNEYNEYVEFGKKD